MARLLFLLLGLDVSVAETFLLSQSESLEEVPLFSCVEAQAVDMIVLEPKTKGI